MATPSVQCLNRPDSQALDRPATSRQTGWKENIAKRRLCLEIPIRRTHNDITRRFSQHVSTWYWSCPLRLVEHATPEAQARYCTSFLGLSTWFYSMMRQFCRLLVTTFFVDISCVTFSPRRKNERPRAKKQKSVLHRFDGGHEFDPLSNRCHDDQLRCLHCGWMMV